MSSSPTRPPAKRSMAARVISFTEKTVDRIVSDETAQNMLRPGRRMIFAGALLAFVPPLIIALAPIMLLLMPLLLPAGLTVLAIGVVQAALVTSLQASSDATPQSPVLKRRSPTSGTMAHLGAITASRGEALVDQLAAKLRSNVSDLASGMRNEVEEQLSVLQTELQSWVHANPNLRPYSEGHIGWLTRPQKLAGMHEKLDATERFRELSAALPPLPEAFSASALAALPLPEDLASLAPSALARWQSLTFLLVPGLLTKWYPMYMASLRGDLDRLGLKYAMSAIDTDQSVVANAARLRTEIGRLAADMAAANAAKAQAAAEAAEAAVVKSAAVAAEASEETAAVVGTERLAAPGTGEASREASPARDGSETGESSRAPCSNIVLLCHSKGGVDAAAALAFYPELHGHVRALVTLQAPHSGSAIAQDLAGTDLQHQVAIAAIEKLLRGSRDAVDDLTYAARREFFASAPPYPSRIVPTVCVATSDKRQGGGSLLLPTINYLALRYGGACLLRFLSLALPPPSDPKSSRSSPLCSQNGRTAACARATPSCPTAFTSTLRTWITLAPRGGPSLPPILTTPRACGSRAPPLPCVRARLTWLVTLRPPVRASRAISSEAEVHSFGASSARARKRGARWKMGTT